MGTSSIYDGQVDKSSLMPSDYDDLINESEISNEDKLGEPWKNAKKLMSQYITGSNTNLKGVVNSYIKASGGPTKITQNSKMGIRSTMNLGQLFSNIRQNGLSKTFEELNIDFKGKDVEEILSELVNVISFSSNKKEDIVAKNATIETLSDLYLFIEENNMDISSLENMDDNMFDILICQYISSYIFGKILNDLESRFEKYSCDSNKTIEIEDEFKLYIKNTVDTTYDDLKLNAESFSNSNIIDLLNTVYLECYEVLGGMI